MTPVFKHRPNILYFGFPKLYKIVIWFCKLFKIKYKPVWAVRSPAVVAIVLAIWKDNIFVITEQRSEKVDNPGKWCVPCGYLDWDETGFAAVNREVWEETGLDLSSLSRYLITNNEEQPFFVQTHPSENRQNVALTYCLIYNFEGLKQLPPLTITEEVKNVKWVPISQVPAYTWAFEHDNRIRMAVEKFDTLLA